MERMPTHATAAEAALRRPSVARSILSRPATGCCSLPFRRSRRCLTLKLWAQADLQLLHSRPALRYQRPALPAQAHNPSHPQQHLLCLPGHQSAHQPGLEAVTGLQSIPLQAGAERPIAKERPSGAPNGSRASRGRSQRTSLCALNWRIPCSASLRLRQQWLQGRRLHTAALSRACLAPQSPRPPLLAALMCLQRPYRNGISLTHRLLINYFSSTVIWKHKC